MHLDPPQKATFEQVSQGVERVARFEDFNVWRVRDSSSLTLPKELPYAVVINLDGTLRIGELALEAEEAAFIPKAALANPMRGQQYLIAAPGL